MHDQTSDQPVLGPRPGYGNVGPKPRALEEVLADNIEELKRQGAIQAGGVIRFPEFHFLGDEATARSALRYIIKAIGDDPDRDGLKGTPERVLRSWAELFAGYDEDPAQLFTTFEMSCDEMVVLRDIEFYSTCEHHMLPFTGKAHIGYLPGERVIGISKLARVLEVYARRLQIQERIGQQVADCLVKHLEPRGVGVVLEAQHSCMRCRGVGKQNSVLLTSAMLGSFRNEHKVRDEFYRLIGK